MLSTADRVLELSQKIDDGLSPEQKADPSRLDGLKKTKSGVAQTIDGVLTTLTEVSQYEKADLARFADKLPKLLPPLWPHIEPSVGLEYTLRSRSSPKRIPTKRYGSP